MMLDYLPKISEEQVKEQFDILNQYIIQGDIQHWLNKELQNLYEKNPILFRYVSERAQKFAIGAVMVGDPNSISLSMALEYILILNILGMGIDNSVGLKQFTDSMRNWFNDDDLKGLDSIGEEK